ncbi:hypothetical protein LCGC14_0520290 [marine sediment metagenome]|uniref:Uncharacterized protein n=1 Tax=marine sediment metagenome TaxID=412755 RepID=A0A0F9UK33_9ZZZZ
MDNARNTDGTPYLGHGGGGAAMGDRGTDGKTPWYDERITPEIPLEQIDREAIPDYALVDSRMREQRAADGQGRTPEQRAAGEYVAIDTMDPEVRGAIDAQDNAIEEQDATIDKPRKDVDRWMDDLEKRGDETSDNEAAIKALYVTIAEQSALITGQRAAIEALRVVFEEWRRARGIWRGGLTSSNGGAIDSTPSTRTSIGRCRAGAIS